jgi:uncharacterized protein YggU (UPF0235/DUF167 family)
MYIRVHAVPDARREKVIKETSQVYTISVKEPAEHNRANERIREIVADLCKVPPRQVRLVTGHRSSSKMFSVETGD